MIAAFDHNDHALNAGWATYFKRRARPIFYKGHIRLRRFFRYLVCRRKGHVAPSRPPVPPNGHAPSNYTVCGRCGEPMKFYVVGQHRFGGYDRHVWEAYEFESIAAAATNETGEDTRS